MRALLLDLDGTLTSTALLHKEAWEIALKELGIRVDVDLNLLMGRKTLDIAKVLGGERYLELYELKNSIYESLVPKKANPLPCSRELVEKARERGYKVSVITSSLRRSARVALNVVGIKPDLLVAGDDLPKGKPDPFPVLYALSILGCQARESVGVGDTLYDFQAYSGAGLGRIFLVRGELNLELSEAKGQGAIVVNDLCEVINSLDLDR